MDNRVTNYKEVPWGYMVRTSSLFGDGNLYQFVFYQIPAHVQCSSDISEPKYTRNTRQPNTRIRVFVYTHTRMYAYAYA